MFPHLDDLSIYEYWEAYANHVVSDPLPMTIKISPTFRGSLELISFREQGCRFLGKLAALPGGVNFHSVELACSSGDQNYDFSPLKTFLAASASRIQTLGLGTPFLCK
jgi:hypothetical protein